jgi:hypothetical protein
MASQSVCSASDCESLATLVSFRMGDQKFNISCSTVLPKHVKPLDPAAFAVVSTHQSAQGPRGGLWPFSLWVIHKAVDDDDDSEDK